MDEKTAALLLECLKALGSRDERLAKQIIDALAEAKAQDEIAKVKSLVKGLLESAIERRDPRDMKSRIEFVIETLAK